MKQAYRLSALLSLLALTACGGGSGGSAAAAHNFSAGGANVATLTVGPGPADPADQTFNIPYVTVKVCEPGTSTCATIPNVLVDTGSSGLRLMKSVLTTAGVTLASMNDPNIPADTIAECLPFADGYSWGPVATANVSVGGESTTTAIPIQVIDDSASPNPAAPSGCQSNGTSLNSVDAFDANGVLGVSVLNQDCGDGCQTDANNGIYYTCTSTGACTSTSLAVVAQVANPVASFPTDNNGVILQLPGIASTGAPTASGYLVFGIGTQTNNALDGATVLTSDAVGNFTTQFDGQSLNGSFIDSGSNAYFFNDTTLQQSECGSSGNAAQFYCPASTTSLTATNQGGNGTTSSVSFQVANLKNISTSEFAIDNVAGTAPSFGNNPPYFDWGLPFFYGRTVFVAIEGRSAAGTDGPYYAY